MADREKVIEALHCRAYNDDVRCEDCAYFRPDEKPVPKCDWDQILEDAIELLKGKEANERKRLEAWFQAIVDHQIANAPKDSPMSLDEILESEYKSGISDGLLMAFEILTEGR